MPIPTLVLRSAQELLDQYCISRIPPHVRHEIRLLHIVERNAITLYEERPSFRPRRGDAWTRSPIARIRYHAPSGAWTLYWRDRHQRWHKYKDVEPTPEFQEILSEIHRDPTGIFWG